MNVATSQVPRAAIVGLTGRMFQRKNGATVAVQWSPAEVDYRTIATGYGLSPQMPWTEEATPESSSFLTTQQQQRRQEQPDEEEQPDNIDIADEDMEAFLANLADGLGQVRFMLCSALEPSNVYYRGA